MVYGNVNYLIRTNQVTDNGGLGLLMNLREEGPNDEIRVRTINDWSLNDRLGGQLDLASSELHNVFEQDLVCNSFRDGQWGTIQTLCIPSGMLTVYLLIMNG